MRLTTCFIALPGRSSFSYAICFPIEYIFTKRFHECQFEGGGKYELGHVLILSHAANFGTAPFVWKWKSNGSELALPLDDNHLLFSQPLHFTSPHSQVVFADCRVFLVAPSSSLVFQFSTHFLLIAFLAFNLVLLEVATCRPFFSGSALSSTFSSGSTESASISSAQHLYLAADIRSP